LHVKFAQSLRHQDDNNDTARVRPAGEMQRHEQPHIHISEALRASGKRQRKTIANLILDLRREALVVEVQGRGQAQLARVPWNVVLGNAGQRTRRNTALPDYQ
jgi:hypothetical protein